VRRLAALLGAALGCSGEADSSQRAYIWSLNDVVTNARDGGTIAGLDARSLVTPAGQPIPFLSPPHAALPALQAAGSDGMVIVPAFAEHQPAAYVVAEVWQQFGEAWLQPWYVLFQVPPEGSAPVRVSGAEPIIDVVEPSFFYSPFWQVINVTIPPGASADGYHDALSLLNPRLPQAIGNPLLAPVAPSGVGLAVAEGTSAPVRPLSGEAVAIPRRFGVWARGTHLSSLSFGSGGFTWADDGRIVEVPLYRFARSDGRVLELPDVVGIGPEGSTAAPVPGPTGAQRFGGFTHLVLAVPPTSAGVFLPPDAPLRSAEVLQGAIQIPDVDPAIASRFDVGSYIGRVALNPTCFVDVAGFPDSCRWLDSQSSVETAITDRRPQPVWFTSPLVEYAGKPAPR
jgi:hypothetical protein